jgi:glucose/arabinose dehydrogenase
MLRFLLQHGRAGLLTTAALGLGLFSAALSAAALWACGSPPPKVPEPAPAAEKPSAPLSPVLSEAPSPPVLLREVGFLAPQAALHDPDEDVYLVSNSNGAAGEADGNGFISRVSPEGARVTLKWIDGANGAGLDAPKGLALSGDKLYVADINVVRSFDRKTGEPLGKVAILTAHDLDALAVAPDGTLYVSDTGQLGSKTEVRKRKGKGKSAEPQGTSSEAIYAVDARGVSRLLVKGAELGQPTGLLADAAGLWVANLSGELYRVAADGQRAPGIRLPGSGLHGLLEVEGGRMVIACAETSTVYVGKGHAGAAGGGATPPERFEPLITDLSSPGQLGYDRRRRQLIVPLVQDNALYIQQIPAGEAR